VIKDTIYVTKISISSILSLLKYLHQWTYTADNWTIRPYWIFDVTSYCTVWGLWLTFLPWTILGVIIKRKSGEIPCPLAVEAFAAHLSYICKYDDKYSKWVWLFKGLFHQKNLNSVINFSPSCRSKPTRLSFIPGSTTFKPQKDCKHVIKIIHYFNPLQ